MDLDDTRVLAMVEHVENLELHLCINDHRLQQIARLRHLKRLILEDVRYSAPSKRPYFFACAETPEELYYYPIGSRDHEMYPTASFSQWFQGRLPNLRVLASPFQESMVNLAPLCPRLTRLHIPFSMARAFPEVLPENLGRVCVVSLALDYDCTWLRTECHPEGALPCLRQILHPTTDCLCSTVCCRRHNRLGTNVYHIGTFFIKERVLIPPWGRRRQQMGRFDDDEYFHWRKRWFGRLKATIRYKRRRNRGTTLKF